MTRTTEGASSLVYVNRERTHEVLALVEPGADDVLWSVTERPAGSTDAGDVVVDEVRAPPTAVPGLVRDLEARLAVSGSYFRVDDAQGTLVPLTAASVPDLRAHSVPIPDAPEGTFLEYFHFHRRDGPSRVVLTMPRDPASGKFDRFLLAHYDFAADAPREGRLSVAHPRLLPEILLGRVAGDHIELPRKGYRKLFEPREYEDALGDGWRAKATRAIESAARALRVGRPAAPAPVDAAVPAPAAEVTLALRSGPYRQAVARFLPAAESERVLAAGVLGIRRFVREARVRADHRDQLWLSLLEAGLVVEHGMRTGDQRLVDEHTAQLVRLARSVGPPRPRGA